MSIDRMAYEGGIGPETLTSTDVSAIEMVFERVIKAERDPEYYRLYVLPEVQAARAELAAKDATIERMREALEEIDRVWEEDLTGEIPYIVTNALSSLPPSDVRLVPVERLREIAELVAGLGYAPDWLAAAIRDAEREKA